MAQCTLHKNINNIILNRISYRLIEFENCGLVVVAQCLLKARVGELLRVDANGIN